MENWMGRREKRGRKEEREGGGREGAGKEGNEGCVDRGNIHKPARPGGNFSLLLPLPELLVA